MNHTAEACRPADLPELCYAVHPIDPDLTVIVSYGTHGFSLAERCQSPEAARKHAESMNRAMKVTPAQRAAMVAGSLFGWRIPAARPTNYTDDGVPIPPLKPCSRS